MKFAFITPRYGAEIGSGPEHACRLLAERVVELELRGEGASELPAWTAGAHIDVVLPGDMWFRTGPERK